jgi:glutamate synthase domain-containing protein 3
VYDPEGTFAALVNTEMVGLEALDDEDRSLVHEVVGRHVEHTGSEVGRRILGAWALDSAHFRKVMPLDYKRVLDVMKQADADGLSEAAALERIMATSHG